MTRYPFSNSDPTAEITVTVTDGTNAIQGAVVTFTDHDDTGVKFTGTTNASGECTIEVPLEKYDVTAKATNYVDYTHPSTVTVSGDANLSIAMTIVTDTLTVTVNDGTTAISGATVTIGATTKTTGDDGVATFTSMPYDDYSAEISATGYTTKTETLVFRSNHKAFTISLEESLTSGTVDVIVIVDDEPYEYDCSPHLVVDEETIAEAYQDETNLNVWHMFVDGDPTKTQIPVGTYTLNASSGSWNYEEEVTVDGNETITIRANTNG